MPAVGRERRAAANIAATMNVNDLVDAGAIADKFNVTRQTVHGWRHRGEIPFVRVGGTIRFDMREVLRAKHVAADANMQAECPDGVA